MGQIPHVLEKSWGYTSRSGIRQEPHAVHRKLGELTNLRPTPGSHTLKANPRKENAMNATEILLFLFMVRLILPFGLLILFGESMNRRERARFSGR